MINFLLTQCRIPQRRAWDLRIVAHFTNHLLPPEIDEEIAVALESGQQPRTQPGEYGYPVAALTGLYANNMALHTGEEICERLDFLIRPGNAFDSAATQSRTGKTIACTLPHCQRLAEALPLDIAPVRGIFVADRYVVSAGVERQAMLCHLAAELRSHIGPTTTLLVLFQEQKIGMISAAGIRKERERIDTSRDAAARVRLNCIQLSLDSVLHDAVRDAGMRAGETTAYCLAMSGADPAYDASTRGDEVSMEGLFDPRPWYRVNLGWTDFEVPPGADTCQDEFLPLHNS